VQEFRRAAVWWYQLQSGFDCGEAVERQPLVVGQTEF
jgi:hypothetical protein